MSNEYFFSAPSMQEGVIKRTDICNYLSGKKKRFRDSEDPDINCLVARNRYMLDFLGITLTPQLSDHQSGRGLKYETTRYIGAVPTVMPNGSQGGDICIYPNLGFPKNVAFEELSSIFNLLGETIKIEFAKSDRLRNPIDLKPPMFLEALKYIDLYEVAIKENWRKFHTEKRVHSYTKSSTDWRLYARNYYDPNKRLQFVSNDSILTKDHKEWRQLKYVYELACAEIEAPTTPKKTKNKYLLKMQLIDNQVKDIKSEKTKEIIFHATDPKSIKELKVQAKRLLDGFTDECPGWRIDIAEVYERFVQYLLRNVASKLGGREISNYKISGSGQMPSWGLKYLEPDAVVSLKIKKDGQTDECLIIADAKYKSNMYNPGETSKMLKDTHRHDLHQVLGYCSFAPQKNKLALIVYPSNEFISRTIFYNSSISGISNKVLLVGVVFRADRSTEMIKELCKVISENI